MISKRKNGHRTIFHIMEQIKYQLTIQEQLIVVEQIAPFLRYRKSQLRR